MANMICTTYQANSFKIIKSTFNTYELPHAPVIFSINFGIFNCFEIPTEPKISDKMCRFTEFRPLGGQVKNIKQVHELLTTSKLKFSVEIQQQDIELHI